MSTELKENIMPAAPKAPVAKPKKKRRIASLDKKKARAGWIFLLPFILGLLFIYLPVIFNSIRFTMGSLEFTRVNDGDTIVMLMNYKFEGLEYYKEALRDNPDFPKILTAGLKQLVIDVPAIVIFSLFMAVLLNQKMFGRAAFRAIFFIPVIVSTGVIATMDADNALLNSMVSGSSIDTGAGEESGVSQIVSATDINVLFSNMAIGSGFAEYVSKLVNDIYNIINRSGVQMLIFLAGLQSISGAIYESCSIDGASAWETFWKITLPMVSPMILVNTVYTVIDSFTSSSNSVMRFINDQLTKGGGEFLATAMAWIYFLIVVLIILVVMAVLRVFIFYQRRD